MKISRVISVFTAICVTIGMVGGGFVTGASASGVHIISFDANLGTIAVAAERTAATAADGRLTVPLPVPTRANFTFAGWFTDRLAGEEVTPDRVFDARTTVFARWNGASISFDLAYTATPAPVNPAARVVSQNGTLGTDLPALPVRTGFHFNGWYTARSGGSEVTAGTVLNANTALFAQWSQVFTVTFDPDGGAVAAPSLLTGRFGRLETTLPVPTRTGFTFVGWFDARTGGTEVTRSGIHPTTGALTGTVFSQNRTVFARWRVDVSLNPNGGTFPSGNYPAELRAETVGANGRLTAAQLLTPTRAGFAFDGWFTNEGNEVTTTTVFSVNTAVSARWSPIYTITFNSRDGTLTTANAQTGANGKLTLTAMPITLKENEFFRGWFTELTGGDNVTLDYKFDGNATVHAQWGALPAAVIFDTSGGSAVSSVTAGSNGRLASFPANPVKADSVFDGWWTTPEIGGERITANTIFSRDNNTIFARWRDEQIVITFDPNIIGAVLSTTSAQINTGTSLGSLLPIPTRTGYTFAGWFSDPAGGTEVTATTQLREDSVVYARWFHITVSFNVNGGIALTPANAIVGGDGRLSSLPVPTRAGFAFDGWTTAQVGGVEVTESRVYSTPASSTAVTVPIFAQWSPVTVSFHAGSGATVNPTSSTVNPTDGRVALPVPTRSGWSFNGWYTSETDGESVEAQNTFTENTTLYAQWSQNRTITLSQNYTGAPAGTTQITGAFGRLAGLPEPTRTGFVFNGWFTTATGGTEVTNETVYTANAAIYAQWAQIRAVTFNPQGGILAVTSANTGAFGRLAALPVPTRTGLSFVGWFTSATGGVQVTEDNRYTSDTTLFARWSVEVRFDPNGGAVTPLSVIADESGRIGVLPVPVRIGFAFNGWFTAATGGTEISATSLFSQNTTIFAQWSQVYTVAFDAQGGETELDTVDTGLNGLLPLTELPIPTKSGFVFDGWFTAAANGTAVSISRVYTANTTLFAQWTSVTVTVTLDPNAVGAAVGQGTVELNRNGSFEDGELPVPTRTGFNFNGWFTAAVGGELITTETVFVADTTVFAQWSPVFTVTFDANGGVVTPTSVRTGANSRLESLPIPTNGDLVFGGWFTERTGGIRVTADRAYTESTTLYARWSEAVAVITFVPNISGATLTVTSAIVGEDGLLSALPVPTRTGFAFKGWFMAASGGTAVTVSTVFTANASLFAQWAPIAVTFNPNGAGAVVTPTTAAVGTDGRLTAVPTPTRPGFTFDGWFATATGGVSITAATVYEEDTTIYAVWSAITVEFEPNAGDAMVTPTSSVIGASGSLSALPVPIRSGFAFIGWFTQATGGTQIGQGTLFTENATVYAQWAELFTVTFNPQGGVVTPTALMTGEDGMLVAAELPVPTRAGFAFNGWFVQGATGGQLTRVTSDTVFTRNVTVHAQWSQVRTVTFDAQGGETETEYALTGANSRLVMEELPVPVREGFDFVGWFTAQSGGAQVTTDRQYSTNTTLYARWVSDSERIPGDVLGTGAVTINDALEILKFLAKLPSEIDDCELAFRAACIIGAEKPTICDALEILKFLAKLPNVISGCDEGNDSPCLTS
jgi:uncharacterized repeat protein (TIGR02543 family)